MLLSSAARPISGRFSRWVCQRQAAEPDVECMIEELGTPHTPPQGTLHASNKGRAPRTLLGLSGYGLLT
jgi:hypothetical protein